MITYNDFFAGFGGASVGLHEAGMELRSAYNHWDRAIETHAANFRDADHVQSDLSSYDMRKVPRTDVLWASPECTWHSPAGGRKRVRADLDLFDDYVPDAAGERSRATMWDVVRAAEAKQFKVVLVENVVEVTTWPLFETWLSAFTTLGYDHQILCVSAAHIGSPTNAHAPQWRDRIYFVFYKRGIKMPDVQPRPLAWCSQCDAVVESTQSWKRTDRRRVGKYGQQYVYVCAAGRHSAHVVEPYVLPAAAAIDWSDLGTRIGDRAKPLAPATIRRIEAGLRMFARPTVVASHGQTWDAASSKHPQLGDPSSYYRVTPADETPLNARTATPGDAVAVPPFVVGTNHGAEDGGRQFDPTTLPLPTRSVKLGEGMVVPPFMTYGYDYKGGDTRRIKPITDPMGTVVADGRHHQLVVPPDAFMAELWGTSTARSVHDPLSAVTAGGNHHGLTVPDGAFLSRQYGSRGGQDHLNTSVGVPTHPITASGGNHALVIPYRAGKARRTSEPLPTVPTSNVTALVQPDIAVEDCLFRMLSPREHLAAQRFPGDYLVHGNKSEQTKGAGNAVASNVAHYLGVLVGQALGARSERVA